MGIPGRMRRNVEHASIETLTTGPVLETLTGTRARIALLAEEDLRLLLRHFGCGIEELDYAMWTGRHNRRRVARPTNLLPGYGLFRRSTRE